MRPMGDTRAHFWLMMRMSKTVGVDLGEALREGRLSARSYADAAAATTPKVARPGLTRPKQPPTHPSTAAMPMCLTGWVVLEGSHL